MKYTVEKLLAALEKIEDKNRQIFLSTDDGDTILPLNLMGNFQEKFVLIYSKPFEKIGETSTFKK